MPENITWRGGTQSGERELPAAPPRRLARGGNGGQTAPQGAARSHDMLFGAVVQHTHPHLLGCGNGKFGNAGLVELGTQAELRIEAQVLHMGRPACSALCHKDHPWHSMP